MRTIIQRVAVVSVFLKRMSHFIDDLIIIFPFPLKKKKKGVRIGEKVPQAEISGISRTRRPGQTAQDDRRSGENLVPKSSHQMEVSQIDNNSSYNNLVNKFQFFFYSLLFFLKNKFGEFEKQKKKEQLHYQ